MDLDIENLDEKSFLSKLAFQFVDEKPYSNVLLSQVLPIDSEISYCAYISGLNLIINKGRQEVSDFDTLFQLLGLEKSTKSLELIRKEQQIYEGDHLLDEKIKDVVSKISKDSKYVYIKCAEDTKTVHYWKIALNNFLQLDSFLNELPVNWGEFDFFDEFNNWFIKIHEDDPLVYLATKDLIVRQICEQHPSKFILAPKSMVFCK